MNYIDTAREALVKAAEEHNLDEWQTMAYTLLVLVKGGNTTLADVHDAWAVGRNVDRPDHKDLIPFEQLSAETAAWDEPFLKAIHKAAQEVSAGTAGLDT